MRRLFSFFCFLLRRFVSNRFTALPQWDTTGRTPYVVVTNKNFTASSTSDTGKPSISGCVRTMTPFNAMTEKHAVVSEFPSSPSRRDGIADPLSSRPVTSRLSPGSTRPAEAEEQHYFEVKIDRLKRGGYIAIGVGNERCGRNSLESFSFFRN